METIRYSSSPSHYPPMHVETINVYTDNYIEENARSVNSSPVVHNGRISTPAEDLHPGSCGQSESASVHSELGDQAAAGIRSFSVHQKITLLNLALVNLCGALFGSLIAPFFPSEATQKKGISQTEVGLIFGCYQLIVFIFSPIWGNYMTRIGPKFMYVTGILVCSSCAILFGVLEWCPPGHVFLVMCLLCRSLEAVASCAAGTCSSAIATHTFPRNVSTVMGILSACGQIGLILGPPVGGALYSYGGFHVPFFVAGGCYMFVGIISIFLLPSPKEKQARGNRSWRNLCILLCTPTIIVMGLLVFAGQAVMGFIDIGLALHLKDIKPGIDNAYIGLLFLLPSVIMVILAPLYGFLGDKFPIVARPLMLIGCFLAFLAFLGMGPSPWIPFLPRSLLAVIVSLCITAGGWAALILVYNEFVKAARARGFDMSLDTQAVISGLYNTFGSLGAFVGPIAGGYLNDNLGFPLTSSIFAATLGFCTVLLLILMIGSCCSSICKTSDTEDEPLLVDDEVTIDSDDKDPEGGAADGGTSRHLDYDINTNDRDLEPPSHKSGDNSRHSEDMDSAIPSNLQPTSESAIIEQ